MVVTCGHVQTTTLVGGAHRHSGVAQGKVVVVSIQINASTSTTRSRRRVHQSVLDDKVLISHTGKDCASVTSAGTHTAVTNLAPTDVNVWIQFVQIYTTSITGSALLNQRIRHAETSNVGVQVHRPAIVSGPARQGAAFQTDPSSRVLAHCNMPPKGSTVVEKLHICEAEVSGPVKVDRSAVILKAGGGDRRGTEISQLYVVNRHSGRHKCLILT